MKRVFWWPLPLTLVALSACTTIPAGPSVMALPGSGKSFDQFRADDAACRQFAFAQIGGASPGQAAADSAVATAAVGTALGAAAGVALGGGRGAAVGAGTGLLVGSAIGANNAQYSGQATQRGYDAAYIQCMYASGNRVPVYGAMMVRPSTPAAPRYDYGPPPPPPPGYPGADGAR
ncbi:MULTISPECIES: YMGG-like glycine zipper-containing protein [Ralstonia]|jgi:hypothetical protein|uniref:Glycine-zipper-containing OmpA-like membrane domain-containing protein n=1 Tax=Ralstonia flaminis TaxID=3058597 RepID=A0ABM9KBC3_9RALS|nr:MULTISPECIES: YMGG-like glycine zipper-containing protein [unclassified Ralstonia]CAJ0822726.1 hypothetical protein LMG18101_05152 [Ralstonia sp. LMG 18101]